MPLTFAHPAAILPFSRKSNYINFSALVFGSMSPDFEYFLNGRPHGEIGHTFSGFIYYNLPLVLLIYLIYHAYIHQTLMDHLPTYLQDSYIHNPPSNKALNVTVLIYSALLGMLTHVIWDSYTHVTGQMVVSYPSTFTKSYPILEWNIPLYKIIQHSSTFLGIIIILGYVYYRAMLDNTSRSTVSARQKIIFWFTVFFMTFLMLFTWDVLDSVSIFSYGIMVVRMIDSFFISLFLISFFFNKCKSNTRS